ncbi:MAG: S49 family peptidase [Vicinamibacterales bacterium]
MSSPSPVVDGFIRGITQAFVLVAGVFACLAILGVVLFAISVGIGAGLASSAPSLEGTEFVYESGDRASQNQLLSVRVEGPILGTAPRDQSALFLLGGVTYGYDVQQLLDDAAGNSRIKGVLLHLQTPGGTIFGSRAIHDGVVAYQQRTKRPVIAYVEGLSASGGVMAMVGATKIYADHGSLVGSIGVLGPQLLFYNKPVALDGGLLESGVVTQGGIEQTIVTAGRGKDLGNPYRRPTEEEVASLQAGVDAEYDQFVAHVARFRHIEPDVIRNQLGAMIFDNGIAEQVGLIDGTASRDEAVESLAKLSGVGSQYQLVRPGRTEATMLRRLLSAWSLPAPSRTLSPSEVLRTAFCAAVRTPLVYYGDPSAFCR